MLIIEDGTGKADAQSYATVAELVIAANARGIVLPATEPEQEQKLIEAIEYMESLTYKGQRYSREQALSFPRTNVMVDGWLQPYNELPRQLKMAQIQLALDAIEFPLLGNVAAPSAKGAVIEETVEGAVTTKYAPPSAGPAASLGSTVGVTPDGAVLVRARSLLRPLLAGMSQIAVGRA